MKMKFFICLSICAVAHTTVVHGKNSPIAKEREFNEVNYENFQVQKMWDAGYDGSGVNVAILDSGITDHPDLDSTQMERAYYCYAWRPFMEKCVVDEVKGSDLMGHGTHIAGTISASNNQIGIAPKSSIYSFNVLGETKISFKRKVIHALEFIQKHNEESTEEEQIHIVNMSFWIDSHKEIENLIQDMYERQNVLFVSAASNTGISYSYENEEISDTQFLGSLDSVINVGNIDTDLIRHVDLTHDSVFFTGKYAKIVAPGTDIISTVPLKLDTKKHYKEICEESNSTNTTHCIESLWDGVEDGYVQKTGASMSAGLVTGYLALLKNQFPNLTSSELRDILFANTVPRPGVTSNTPGDSLYGNGVLQAVPFGPKYLIETNWNTYLYDIPVDDKNYYYPATLPTNTLEAYLEWTNPASINNETWLKVKIDEDLYKWVLLDEVHKLNTNVLK